MHIASTRQRSDSAEYGRREILVFDTAAARVHPSERPVGHDHQGRDRLAVLAEQRVVLERLVEVGLAIEDRDGDVAAAGEQSLELIGVVDGRDREAGRAELGRDRRRPRW